LTLAENCPAGVTKAFTPSACKDNTTAPSTAAGGSKVDDDFVAALGEFKQYTYDAAGATLWYGSYCGDKDGEVLVKTYQNGVDDDEAKAWACAEFYQKVYGKFDCKTDWVCATRDPMPACESVSAMMTAVCKLTADEIKTKVDKRRTDGYCKNKADGGMEWAAPAAATTSSKTTPDAAISAASGSSPMWALALAACLFSAMPAV
jgi:hypothetical protein